jgi:hypothetical protein
MIFACWKEVEFFEKCDEVFQIFFIAIRRYINLYTINGVIDFNIIVLDFFECFMNEFHGVIVV